MLPAHGARPPACFPACMFTIHNLPAVLLATYVLIVQQSVHLSRHLINAHAQTPGTIRVPTLSANA